MLYLLPSGGSLGTFDREDFGVLAQPRNGGGSQAIKDGMFWGYDNDCFNGGFDHARWSKTWKCLEPYSDTCLFACVPDVVGDAERTLTLWREYKTVFLGLGVPLAFVAQDGSDSLEFPPESEWQCLFIGGTNEFKLGSGAEACVRRAKQLGKWVHMGRVNSRKRIMYADSLGCDSVDGTYLCFARDVNGPRLKSWMNAVNATVRGEDTRDDA